MTPDDEAFVRGVVDRPGDELARLVYADWLDDRGDPRGAYLRAEHEWAKAPTPAAEKKLRAAGKALDPVWAARVSRPPVGVCCEHLSLSRREEHPDLPNLEDIAADESALRLTFPPQLRAVLTNYSLGWLRGGPFVATHPDGATRLDVTAFVCAIDPDREECDYEVSCETFHRTDWLHSEHQLDARFVFLASALYGWEFVVSCGGDDPGTVYLYNECPNLESPEPYFVRVADTVGDFLNQLTPGSWPIRQPGQDQK
jgi:uncharacterized protein (TIGR02996 family)